ncbi:MAG: helix-turn-helix domain-containing protein [Pseudonocardiaceae bacterium]
MPTGQLIRLYRIDRKKSTVNIATHAGITARYLEMIEAGNKTPSLPVLRKLAKVLGVRTAALLGEPPPSEDYEGPVKPRLAEVERALYTYRSLSLSDRETLPELPELAMRINAAWDASFTSQNKYTGVLSVLPDLIVDVECAVNAYNRSAQACRLASEVYQLARPVLKHLGRVDLGGLVSERTMRYSEETEDPLLIGAATWNLGQALYADDMPHGAFEVAVRGAEKLEPLLPEGTPAHFAAYGGLQQLAAISVVRLDDPWRARELLRGPAWDAAARVGEGRDDHHIYFGPTNVRIHMMHVEQQVDELSDAAAGRLGVSARGLHHPLGAL